MTPQLTRVQNEFEPGMVYHPHGGAQYVSKPEEEEALQAKGFNRRYVHQHYPSVVINSKGEKKQVNSKAEHQKLGPGWDFVGHEEAANEAKAIDPAEEMAEQMEALQAQVQTLTLALAKATKKAKSED